MSSFESYVARLLPDVGAPAADLQRRGLSRRTFLSVLPVVEFCLDAVTCLVVMAAVETWMLHLERRAADPQHQLLASGIVAFAFIGMLVRRNSRTPCILLSPVRATADAVTVCMQTLLGLSIAHGLSPRSFHVLPLATAVTLLPLALSLARRLWMTALERLQDVTCAAERVLLLGDPGEGGRVARAMQSLPHLALRPVAVLSAATWTPREVEKLLETTPCEVIMLLGDALSAQQQASILFAASRAGVRIVQPTSAASTTDERFLREILCIDQEEVITSRVYEGTKRLIDVVGSSILLVLLLPVLLVIAALVRFSSKGPALFVQQRVGKHGALFRMYKFRSMTVRAPRYRLSPKSSDDPRVTGLGRILRRSSLDELPQLLNVLLGQMSLVGPRPEMPFIVRSYGPLQKRRLLVRPGITGLWQLSWDRSLPIHENLHHDLSYIRHRTLSLDLAILIHTLFFAMHGGV